MSKTLPHTAAAGIEMGIKKFILAQLLYNRVAKACANRLLEWPLFLRNRGYRYVLRRQIKRVIDRYRYVPFALRIENTNICNARCYLCPHPSMKRRKGSMSRELYKKLIDEACRWGVGYVNLHNFGEPLLDKDFAWRVAYAKRAGIARISTNTNAQQLDERLAQELIEAGHDEIIISLDALSQEMYEKIRTGLDYKKVLGNVEGLMALKRRMNVAHPRVIVDFLECDLNRHERKAFIRRWRHCVDDICISKIHDWSSAKKGIVDTGYRNYVSFSQAPCRLPFTELLINWDGSASLCCQDIEGEVIVGDANKESLKEIWTGDTLNRVREKHLALDVNRLTLCKDCTLRTFWWVF